MLSVAFGLFAVAAEDLILNSAEGRFRKNGGVEVIMETQQVDGRSVLRIVNRTARKPNTYGVITWDCPLKADLRYRLTLRARGEKAGGLVFAFGPKWQPRFLLLGIQKEWKEYSFEFTPSAREFGKNGTYPVSLLSENVANEALLTDMVIAPVPEVRGIVPDGSFESAPTDVSPPGWQFYIRGNAAVKMVVSERKAVAGSKSLLITNSFPRKPNVYGLLSRKIRVKAGVKYRLTFQARGENANGIAFMIGKRWRPRMPLGALPNSWKKFSFEFTPQPEDFEGDGTLMLHILSESVADAAYLDDVRIVPAGGETIQPEDFQSSKVYPLPLEGMGIPLELPADRTHYQGEFPEQKAFHAQLFFGRAPGGLAFSAEVTDRDIRTPDNEKFWNGDSLQLRFSPGLFRDRTEEDIEFTFQAPTVDGVVKFCDSTGNVISGCNGTMVSGAQTEDGYRISGVLSPSQLKGIDLDIGFTINAVINNVNGNGNRREIAFLGNGIHRQKGAQENLRVLPEKKGPQLFAVSDRRSVIRRVEGLVYATGFDEPKEWRLAVSLTDSSGKVHPLDLEEVPAMKRGALLAIGYDFDLAKIPEGKFTLKFEAPGRTIAELRLEKADLRKRQLDALRALEERFVPLEEQIRTVTAPSRYLTVPRLLIRDKLEEFRRNLETAETPEDLSYYTRIGEWVVPELQAALKLLETNNMNRERLPATWLYRLGSDAGEPFEVAQVPAEDEKGRISIRPYFFGGYGHFEPVVEDMPLLVGLGNSMIQQEIGPRSFFPESFDKVSLDDFRDRIEPGLKRALENNVRVCLLLSPHYHPAWWLEANPELKSDSGFFKYEINHPESRKMIRRYLDIIIPLLRQSPYRAALHSLCLSNEPVYTGARLDKPFTRKLFFTYLKKEYGALEQFNRTAGTNFPNFEALAEAGLENPAVNYEFHRWKRAALAEWHAWMAGVIRSHWPEAKLSAKIMVFKTLEPAYNNEAVDPELFAAFSDYNGNDNYMYHRTGRWISDWYTMAMYHDLQRSSRNMPVLNSENHVIKDGDWQNIPFEHIYAATFEQFLQGVTGVVTWVWRAVPPESARKRPDLPGNVYQRPASILAQSMAILDGNRLAPEISAFVAAPPLIGILYSPTSYIQNPSGYVAGLKQIYPALAMTGHKIGFRTENQLMNGDFGSIRLLFLPDCTHLPGKVIEQLETFRKQGGKIVTIGRMPCLTPHGKPLAQTLRTDEALPGDLPLPELARKAGTLADQAESLPLHMSVADGENSGVIYRIVSDGKAYLINIANYETVPRHVMFSKANGTLSDLVTTYPAEFAFELKPLEVRFLRFQPE